MSDEIKEETAEPAAEEEKDDKLENEDKKEEEVEVKKEASDMDFVEEQKKPDDKPKVEKKDKKDKKKGKKKKQAEDNIDEEDEEDLDLPPAKKEEPKAEEPKKEEEAVEEKDKKKGKGKEKKGKIKKEPAEAVEEEAKPIVEVKESVEPQPSVISKPSKGNLKKEKQTPEKEKKKEKGKKESVTRIKAEGKDVKVEEESKINLREKSEFEVKDVKSTMSQGTSLYDILQKSKSMLAAASMARLESKVVIDQKMDDYSSSSSSEEELAFQLSAKLTRSKLKAASTTRKKALKARIKKDSVDEDDDEKLKKDKKKFKSRVSIDEIPIVSSFTSDIFDIGQKEPSVQQVGEEKKDKEQPPKKSKKEKKKKMTAEMMEQLRIQQEEEAKREAEELRIRLEEERKQAIENERKETSEQALRMEQLVATGMLLDEISQYNAILKKEAEKADEWERYIKCGWLPNPTKCDELSSYIHLWGLNMENTTIEEASARTSDVMEVLTEIDDVLDSSQRSNPRKVENLKWVRQLFRDYQQQSLDVATYRIIRFVETKMNRLSLATSDFNFQNDFVKFCIWLRKILPTPLPNPRRPPRPRIEVNFDMMNVKVLCPVLLDSEGIAIRALYHTYDHYSDLSSNYYMPEIHPVLKQDLMTYMKNEWRNKLIYKYNSKCLPDPDAPEGNVKKDAEICEMKPYNDFSDNEDIPVVPYKKLSPTPNEFVLQLEGKIYGRTRTSIKRNYREDVINLRQYTILGGVYKINLIKEPPQPQEFILKDMYITTLYLPKELKEVPFYVEYKPPQPVEAGVIRTPEEIEEELRKQEEEMDKLILITLKWPQHVVFLDLPIVCFWNEEKLQWTKKDVFDLKHVEEQGILSFRTGRFGTFALATFRYSHLPFQAWELKPEEDGSVTLQLTAAILMLEFNVKASLVCLSQLQNCPNNALKEVVGKYMDLHRLIRIMQNGGIDIFPTFDAFCYVEGVCEKHWQTEKHLYHSMAQLYSCFNFAWSRWNVSQGRRNIVFQMREYHPNQAKKKNYSMVLVTPLKASYIDCTEVSQSFLDEDLDSLKFSADLYQLMRNTTSIIVRSNVSHACKEVVHVLAHLLVATRVHSFS